MWDDQYEFIDIMNLLLVVVIIAFRLECSSSSDFGSYICLFLLNVR